MASTTEVTCRSCGRQPLMPVLDLGRTPLANALLTEAQLKEPEATYPLELVLCASCSLVQITETVPPEQLFGNYLYFSSFSETMLRHAASLVAQVVESRRLGPQSLVVEIASNDGYLLQYYHQRDIPVLGIEPAANIAEAARAKGIPTRTEFFGEAVGRNLADEGLRADVIHANNVLAHVADLNGFVAGIRRLLAPTGVAVIEAPYLQDFLDHGEFDTIYHEHLCYFSLTALQGLMTRQGLQVSDVARVPIHGGSLRLFVTPAEARPPNQAVGSLLAAEAAWGIAQRSAYEPFVQRVATLRQELPALLRRLKADGKRIAAYGASAKGSTLLNTFGIGRDLLDFVVDRSTVKQGYYTPGTHLPIRSPEALLSERPDYVLLLTWNFAPEILAQQQAYRDAGGRFIVPIPELTVV